MENKLKGIQNVLINLENAGIETREFHLIKQDIEDTIYSSHVLLIDNDKFKAGYDRQEQKMIFQTTYSNQDITEAFISEMMEIQDMLPLLEQGLEKIFLEETA